MKKSPYLICSDLDSTLLADGAILKEESQRYIQKICQNGHYFIMSSGRPYQGMSEYIAKLSLPNMPVSAFNGAAIVWPNLETKRVQKAVVFPIPLPLFQQLYLESRPILEACLAANLYHVYTLHESKLPFWVIHKSELVEFHEGEINELASDDILTATFVIREENCAAFEKIKSQSCYDDVFIHDWGVFYDGMHNIEVSMKIANKGHALQYLQELFQIEKTHTIAYGDAPNDLSMILEAYDGVMMINAPEAMKEQGPRISEKSCEDNGVIHDLKTHYPELDL